MKYLKFMIATALILGLSAPLAAQDDAVHKEQKANEEQRREREEAIKQAEVRMREAEMELEEAARRIAELSAAQLARAESMERQFLFESKRPMIGITVGGPDSDGPVEGVIVGGISPGGAAEEAGLLAGDIITAVNEESLSSENSFVANRRLLDFMSGVEEGDVLDIEYLRNNKPGKVELEPMASSSHSFSFSFDGGDFDVPVAPTSPNAPQVYAYRWMSESRGHGFGELEMVELNDSLGRYFGTESGLLIIKAPEDNAFKLQDGDVIMSIDGREPQDLHHAVRILSSYEAGETVNFEIMRDKRKQTLTIEVPDNRHSMLSFAAPKIAPAAEIAPAPRVAPSIMVVPSRPSESAPAVVAPAPPAPVQKIRIRSAVEIRT